MERSPNRPRRREPYHYDATGAQYIACIETAHAAAVWAEWRLEEMNRELKKATLCVTNT